MKGSSITKKYTIINGEISNPLDVKGLPDSGKIVVDDECNASVAVVSNNYCSIKKGDTTSINSNTSKCVIDENEIPITSDSCFIFDEISHTITGYNYDNPTCPSEISIPATINDISVEHISDYAFVNGEYNLEMYYGFKEYSLEEKEYADQDEYYGTYDIKANVLKLGYNNISMLELFKATDDTVTKNCYDNIGNATSQKYNYAITDSDAYDFCYFETDLESVFTFASSTGITKVDFSNATNLIDIGTAAFYNNEITYVNFGELPKLTSLGISSFARNNITGNVDLSGLTGLTTISNGVFYVNNISKVILPSTITSIGFFAFHQNNLQELTLPSGITSIGYAAFSHNHLKEIDIPSEVINIGISAFGENDLTNINFNNKVKYIQNKAFISNELTSLNLPNSVIVIGDLAFGSNSLLDSVEIPNNVEYLSGFNYTNISSITIPNSVKEIGIYAFLGVPLTSLNIPNSVEAIRNYAFSETSLTSLTLGTNLTRMDTYAFFNIKSTIDSVVIPSGISTISIGAFSDTKITNLTIGDNVETIGEGAFFKSYIKNLTWGTKGKLKVIDNYAFQNIATSSVDIPSGVTKIGNAAFVYGSETTVNIPDTVTTIGYSAFSGSKITTANIGSGITSIGSNGFGCFNDRCKGIAINIARAEGKVKGSPWGAREPVLKWTGTE